MQLRRRNSLAPALLRLAVPMRQGLLRLRVPGRSRRQLALFGAGVGSAVLAWGGDPAPAGPEPQRRPDAAQEVQEGDVQLWLQYYQRERGQDWERARTGTQRTPVEADTPQPAPQVDAPGRRAAED